MSPLSATDIRGIRFKLRLIVLLDDERVTEGPRGHQCEMVGHEWVYQHHTAYLQHRIAHHNDMPHIDCDGDCTGRVSRSNPIRQRGWPQS